MKCSGCNGAVRGTKYWCVECDGVIYCQHCQRGGLHSHHTIVEFNGVKPERGGRPYDSYAAAYLTTVGSTDIGATSFLPYGIDPVAPPSAQPSSNSPTKNAKSTAVEHRSSDVDNRSANRKAVPSPGSWCQSQALITNVKAPGVPSVPKPRIQKSHYKVLEPVEHDEYTANWAPAQPDALFRRVPLNKSDPEFNAVIQNMKQMGGKRYTSKVIEICRIENYRLYKTYKSCREDMIRVNDPGTASERILWHGTSADILSSIYRDGFNRSYCGKNATAYGDGVYFATSFSYSASSTYSPPNAKGHKYIFQCLVLTGHFAEGTQGLKEPPMRTVEFRYDSVVDDEAAPTMFVVFKDMQVYPEYVITLNL